MGRLVFDEDARVCAWLDEQMGVPGPAVEKASIGYERNGNLVAGVVFDNKTDNNVFAHIASTAVIFPLALIVAVARYAYMQLELERLTFLVRSDNAKCLRFVKRLGAQYEGKLERATRCGDLLFFVLWRDSPVPRRLCAAGRL